MVIPIVGFTQLPSFMTYKENGVDFGITVKGKLQFMKEKKINWKMF